MLRWIDGPPGVLPNPATDPDRVRRATHDILGRPEFRPPRRSLIAAAWHWVSTEIGNLLGGLVHLGGGGTVAGAVVAIGVAALVVGMVWLIVRHWPGVPARRGHRPVTIAAGRRARPADEWRAEAAAHEAAGRWREALRARYRALVADLAGRGLVDEIPGRTSGEYRRQVDVTVPAAAEPFDEATDLFEQTWYGTRPSGPHDQTRFDQLADRVLTTGP